MPPQQMIPRHISFCRVSTPVAADGAVPDADPLPAGVLSTDSSPGTPTTEARTLLEAENVTVTVSPVINRFAGRMLYANAAGRLDVDAENTVYGLPLESMTELVIAPPQNTTIESPTFREDVNVITILAVADVLCPITYGFATACFRRVSRLINSYHPSEYLDTDKRTVVDHCV